MNASPSAFMVVVMPRFVAKSPRLKILAVALLVASLLLVSLPPQVAIAATVRYASPTGLSSGTCNTWANACTLKYALSLAVSGDEIWVKQGTYILNTTYDNDHFDTFSVSSQ